MDKGVERGQPRLRNTPNLGLLKKTNLLVLLSRIKFYEFFGLIFGIVAFLCNFAAKFV